MDASLFMISRRKLACLPINACFLLFWLNSQCKLSNQGIVNKFFPMRFEPLIYACRKILFATV